MDKDRVKGVIDDASGRAKRQMGEWSGDTHKRMEGTAQQVKGKAEKFAGSVKNAVHDAGQHVRREHDRSDENEEIEREEMHISRNR